MNRLCSDFITDLAAGLLARRVSVSQSALNLHSTLDAGKEGVEGEVQGDSRQLKTLELL